MTPSDSSQIYSLTEPSSLEFVGIPESALLGGGLYRVAERRQPAKTAPCLTPRNILQRRRGPHEHCQELQKPRLPTPHPNEAEESATETDASRNGVCERKAATTHKESIAEAAEGNERAAVPEQHPLPTA